MKIRLDFYLFSLICVVVDVLWSIVFDNMMVSIIKQFFFFTFVNAAYSIMVVSITAYNFWTCLLQDMLLLSLSLFRSRVLFLPVFVNSSEKEKDDDDEEEKWWIRGFPNTGTESSATNPLTNFPTGPLSTPTPPSRKILTPFPHQ